jgi:hypothetical protein
MPEKTLFIDNSLALKQARATLKNLAEVTLVSAFWSKF